jgi:predicted DsbA family dithiol-disulfide isomerase
VNPLPVTVFSDFTCPYSYIAESLLWRTSLADVELRFRAFELFPSTSSLDPPPQRFSLAEWSRILELAAEVEIVMTEPTIRPRTRKAHEAARLARQAGLERELRREIFAAYWVESADIGRIDVLTSLGGRVGIEPDEAKIALDIDRFEEDITADRELAARLRIPGTPAIFLGTGRSAKVVVGAQPVGELRRILSSALRSGTENE